MKIKLGELQVMPKSWCRRSISIDHVRCRINDLVNGAMFPPLLVERTTKIIVGGNHRYKAYIDFYGENWRDIEVDVDYIDLPPYNENPVAWVAAVSKDNNHLAERMGYSDRNKMVANVLDYVKDPQNPEVLELAKNLHFTESSFMQFADTYLGQLEEKEMSANRVKLARKSKSSPPVKFKAAHNDVTPGEIRAMETAGTRARVLSKTNSLLAELEGYSPAGLVPRETELFGRLVNELERLLAQSEIA